MGKTRSIVLSALSTFCLVVAGLAIAQEEAKLGQPLDEGDKVMMKNGAMKNMDKYMGTPDAMMKKLPKAMEKAQKAAVANGKKLFNNKKLGANGQTCGSCHPGGGTTGGTVQTPMKSELTGKAYDLAVPSLVGAAATFPKFKVPNDRVVNIQEMSNNCIMMFMGAKGLPLNSPESKELASYLTSLSTGEEMDPGAMPEMMKKMMMKGGM